MELSKLLRKLIFEYSWCCRILDRVTSFQIMESLVGTFKLLSELLMELLFEIFYVVIKTFIKVIRQ